MQRQAEAFKDVPTLREFEDVKERVERLEAPAIAPAIAHSHRSH
jgi:hypothetical protein